MKKEDEERLIGLCQECIKKAQPLIKRTATAMDVIPSETIYSNGDIIIPMADVQHIEKHYYNTDMLNPPVKAGDLMGILVITRHTRWDMDADCWANNIWIGREKAEGFIRDWCYFRYEFDGIRKQMECVGQRSRE